MTPRRRRARSGSWPPRFAGRPGHRRARPPSPRPPGRPPREASRLPGELGRRDLDTENVSDACAGVTKTRRRDSSSCQLRSRSWAHVRTSPMCSYVSVSGSMPSAAGSMATASTLACVSSAYALIPRRSTTSFFRSRCTTMTSWPKSSSRPAIRWRNASPLWTTNLRLRSGIRTQALHVHEVAWRTSRRRRRNPK